MRLIAKTLVVILFVLVLGLMAMFLAKFTMPDHVGFEGGAIVIVYGICGAVTGLIGGIIVARLADHRTIIIVNTVSFVILLVMFVVIWMRVKQLSGPSNESPDPVLPTKPVSEVTML